MTECFQNIIRHGGKAEEEKTLTQDPGFFMTRNSLGKYYLKCFSF